MKNMVLAFFLAVCMILAATVGASAFTAESAEAAPDIKTEGFEDGELIIYSGYAIRGDAKDGLRFYFDINLDELRRLEASGAKVEFGALVNIDKDMRPDFTKYDKQIVSYKTESGKVNGFFVDDDTFAVTLRYNEQSSEVRRTTVYARGYVKVLRSGASTEQVVFSKLASDAPKTLHDAYSKISASGSRAYFASPKTVAFVEDRLGVAVEYKAVYLDAAAPAGGNGSEEKPYNSFSAAFSACKGIMQKVSEPTKVFLVIKDGEYLIHSTQQLTGKDKPYKECYFYIVADGENVTLKTTKDIDADAFVSEGNNVYSYQFEKDKNGKYPSFRCLYVNDTLATIATNGSDRSYNKENLYVTAFDRTYSANSDNAKTVGKMYLPEGVVGDLRHLMEGASNVRTALLSYKIEMHITCQWNYNIVHVAGVDYNDYAMSGGQKHVAVYFDMDEYKSFQINAGYSTAGRYVHMKNADIYLDADGEYRYDEKNGKLYYYSTEGVEDLDFGYATLDNMFIIKSAKNVSFNGISFTGMDDYTLTEQGYLGGLGGMSPYVTLYGETGFQDRAPLYFKDCSGVEIRNCRFYDLPCEALDATGWIEDMIVDSNVFEGIGSAAVRIGTHIGGYNNSAWKEGVLGARNTFVTNNYLYDIANEYYVYAILICKLDGGAINHNTIKQCSYSGICVGWDWNYDINSYDASNKVNADDVEIAYNYITDFMTEMADGGAIYTPTRNNNLDVRDYYLNSIHHNVIVFSDKSGDGLNGMICGIYFDASATNWHCYENVIFEPSDNAAYHGSSRTYADFIYLQRIDTQETYHILVEKNYFLNVGATARDQQLTEVYRASFTAKEATTKRNLKEKDTVFINNTAISGEIAEFIGEVGASGYGVDVDHLAKNAY